MYPSIPHLTEVVAAVHARVPLGQEPRPPRLHSIRVEVAFGDFYALCQSCAGAMSDPFPTERDAERWTCPFEHADFEAQRTYRRWHARLVQAHTFDDRLR